ncbi:MAG: PIG-L family deacetylase [Clostridia bacterium]|nr:PIG-L family deacetylase [Clostridia bacterium]
MKKISLPALILLIAFVLLLSVSADTSKKLAFSYEIETPSEITSPLAGIQDGKYTSKLTLEAGNILRMKTENAAWINIKFYGSAPTSYTLAVINDGDAENAQTLEPGGTGFLHEVTKLPVCDEIMLTSNERMMIAEIELYSDGTLPSTVQQWEKSLSKCDILVISTHSDDDTLFFGALTAEQAAKGRLIQTAFICSHSEELHRLNEMLDGQWTLGVTAYPIVGTFYDHYSTSLAGAEKQFDSQAMSEYIVECIRRTRPQVLVTHDINGEYGHGAHRLTSKLTREALDICADSSVYPESAEKYGVHEPLKTYIHLYKQNEIILNVRASLDELGNATPFSVAEDAYDCHVSQQKWDFAVTTRGTNDCRRFGLFKTLVDCDVTDTDIMNGVTPVFPPVSATSSMNSDNTVRNISSRSTLMHTDSNVFEPFSFFSHDGNGHETKVPKSSVAICFVILMVLAASALAVSIRNLIRNKRS